MRVQGVANILVVDDHPLFREGFAHMVRVLRPRWTLHFSDNAAHALSILSAVAPDLVIVDVGLPGDDGFTLINAIANVSATIPQILISGRDDAAVRLRARACGVRSFIAKTEDPETIAKTIDAVLNGGIVFDAGKAGGKIPALTSRQLEVLMLLADGHGNKEIRHRLNIAERTVRAHLTELFQLLGAHSRMQAIVRARELGLLA
jgi:DNA-binding NarL/FixJ family response regulator